MGDVTMPIFSTIDVWGGAMGGSAGAARGGKPTSDPKKLVARRTGIRGEPYAYWYLRRHGYVFVARNYTPRGIKGELDLVGYDGKTLAFVEVRTRTVREDIPALPEFQRYEGKIAPGGSYGPEISG